MLVTTLLNTFSTREKKRFSRFVNSPYFNTDQQITTLLGLLEETIAQGQASDELWQMKIYKTVFGNFGVGKQLDKKQKTRLVSKMNELMVLAKKFLTIEGLEEHPAAQSEILYQKLSGKQRAAFYRRQLKKERKLLAKQTQQNVDFYNHAFRVETAGLHFLYQKGTLAEEDNLQEVNRNLDLYYLLHKLKLHSTALSFKQVSDKEHQELRHFDALKPLLALPDYKAQPLVNIYLKIINLMETGEECYYFQLLELLESHHQQIPVTNLHDFYKVACNFCINQIVKGMVKYNEHLFELYKKMDDKHLFAADQSIDSTTLKNIITISCKVGDFKWAKEMTHKYHDLISSENTKSVLNFNLGLIAFYENKYKTAIHYFIRVDKINPAYDINCRMLLIKSHYQLDQEYDERTVTIFRNTEQYVHKYKSLNSVNRSGFKNFVRVLILLYKIKFCSGKMTLERVQDKMGKMSYISDKVWLMEKIEELKR